MSILTLYINPTYNWVNCQTSPVGRCVYNQIQVYYAHARILASWYNTFFMLHVYGLVIFHKLKISQSTFITRKLSFLSDPCHLTTWSTSSQMTPVCFILRKESGIWTKLYYHHHPYEIHMHIFCIGSLMSMLNFFIQFRSRPLLCKIALIAQHFMTRLFILL